MALLSPEIQSQVRQILGEMDQPVKILLFTQGEGAGIECTTCADTRHILEEVSALSEKITLETKDFIKDSQEVESYQVDKIPAILFLKDGENPEDYGIRMYGIPSGYEFGSLIEDILMVSRGKASLTDQTLKELEKLDRPVHIQVYVTPT